MNPDIHTREPYSRNEDIISVRLVMLSIFTRKMAKHADIIDEIKAI